MPSLENNLPLHSFAPAKINLTLHVRGRRADGYHELESLVAFATEGDGVSLLPGKKLALTITGPMAYGLKADDDNLIIKAVRALQGRKSGLTVGAFRLEKRLPLASGIGGGSTDAAAALRLVAQINNLPLSDPDLMAAALETGADIPVCLEAQARVMRGIGETLDPPLSLPKMPAVLVNPGVSVATPAVFKALGLAKGETFSAPLRGAVPQDQDMGALISWLSANRNDLEAPAIAVLPKTRSVLNALELTTDCLLARMSGSGATVFGLYPDFDAAENAAAAITAQHPHWWVRAAWLR